MSTAYLIAQKPSRVHLQHLIRIIGGSLFIALCAQISIPLPFSIIPLTFQTFAVLLLARLFGSRLGAYMALAYCIEIVMGFPFAAGGISNPLAIIGPRAGYLVGFIVQAYVFGWFYERSNTLRSFLIGGILACILQLSLGTIWLSHFVGLQSALLMGFYPFIAGEMLKLLTVCSLNKKIK